MSHRPERKEKDCLNCGAEVYGKYCHLCGQANVETKESVWDLITHFVYDITHFDGRFFRTVKVLLLRPGFISLEYLKGKRTCYLNPVQMYVFTSAFFFLFFFSVVKPEDAIKTNEKDLSYSGTKKVIEQTIKTLEVSARNTPQPSAKNKINEKIALFKNDLERLKTDTTDLQNLNFYKRQGSFSFNGDTTYKTRLQYDSIQRTLPDSAKDNWVKRQIVHKQLEINKKYGDDPKEGLSNLANIFLHSFPKMFFISLPLFALLLKLVYIRRKQFFYISHAIYSIHLYCAMFVLIFLFICFNSMDDVPYLGWLNYLNIVIVLYMLWYFYKSLRKFYQQSRAKTIFKFLIILFVSFFMMMFLFVTFLIFSAFSI